MRLSALRALPAFLLAAASLRAQSRLAIPAGAPVTTAVRAAQPPVIDGRDDDAVWSTAPAMSDFLEFSPHEAGVPRFKTEFKVAYDDRNLYVFVRAFDPHPDSIMSVLTRRDTRGPSDQLKIMIDSYNDRRSGFEFAVNPSGVKRDYAMYNDRNEDGAWDGVWEVATKVDSLGWTAEFRIPFSQLRYPNADDLVFGFAVWRDIERYRERTSWPLYRQSSSGISSQLGYLKGIHGVPQASRLEMAPFTVAKSSPIDRSAAPVGESPWGRTQAMSAGADLKYGVTPNLTLDATINPDFGQVEADPSVVNLSAFETFFPEHRPFFIEGSGLYSFGINCSTVNCNGEGLFYSRRIGRTPQLFDSYADVASPNITPIIAAGKLTGRVDGNLNVGVLDAVTGRVEGTLDRTTEPRTNYSVVRAVEDLRDGATSIGVIGTAVDRQMDPWTDSYLRRSAYAYGANLTHRFGEAHYELTANATQSIVNGSGASIYATELSPVHLYQRPDAGLPLDSTRTSLVGDEEQVTFGKSGGNMFHFQSAYDRRSAGYEINDLGYLQRANQQTLNNWQQLAWRTPALFYRAIYANFNEWEYWTIDGLQTELAVNTNWHINLTNTQGIHFGGTASGLGTTYCDLCARGGPAIRQSSRFNYWAGWQGDSRRLFVPSMFAYFGGSDAGRSRYSEYTPRLAINPGTQWQATISVDYLLNHDNTQWLGNFTSGSTTHYSFAHLDQQQLALTSTISYTLTPTLSLQLYASPFVSRGTYDDVRELSADPRASAYDARFLAYTPPAGTALGFDVLQLRSTSVVRWEFKPGSTLYAVWTHGRDGSDSVFHDRSFNAEYDDLFALHPENTFLVKVAYWINR